MDERFAAAAAQAVRDCLDAHSVALADIDMIVAAPAGPGYRAALSGQLGVPVDQIGVADDERMHTAALAAALGPPLQKLPAGAQVLLVAAGAGGTAGAALRQGFLSALSNELGVTVDRISVAADQRMHTAALAAAFEQQAERLTPGAHILLVCAGAGVTAGAALYRQPARVGYAADRMGRAGARS